MEDFDIFTNEIEFTKPVCAKIMHEFVNSVPSTPSGPNYQCGKKLLSDECLAANDDVNCAFHLSESVSATLRLLAVYRDEQMQLSCNKLNKITNFVKPVQDVVSKSSRLPDDPIVNKLLKDSKQDITKMLKSFNIDNDIPLHKKYLKFSDANNVTNFQKILKELPKEWTVVQLTAPFNPNENLKPQNEYKTEIKSIYLSMFTNDYMEKTGHGPITIKIPANVNKEGEKPLFEELYSLLEENYKTINSAQFINKRLVQNYWSKREDIDLRMKSVINVMDKEWLGGWGSLLTGKLLDTSMRDKIMCLVDNAIADWGFIRLTPKQKILLYNLIESSAVLSSTQIKSCIRRILTEQGNIEELRQTMKKVVCDSKLCKDFTLPNELCLQCLSKCFEATHHFSLVDGIRAFSQVSQVIKDDDNFACLKKAKRYPVVLIADEMLDTFPWESLPILNHHPATRMENIHFLYYLYKVHQENIVGGYYNAKSDVGRYVINPEKNLDRMEKRMGSFVKYWCNTWTGHIGEQPPPAEFVQYLTDSDMFLYCGHGDGCHLVSGADIEATVRSRSVNLLSGCGSLRLTSAPGRLVPAAPHHHLHIAACPLVIGMLWEVTDLEVDKVVSTLVSLYTPSDAPLPWPAVGKANWSQGVLDTAVEQKGPFVQERDIARALCRCRGATNFAMIATSLVARGIPVKVAEW